MAGERVSLSERIQSDFVQHEVESEYDRMFWANAAIARNQKAPP
jgi:hypothetical protein